MEFLETRLGLERNWMVKDATVVLSALATDVNIRLLQFKDLEEIGILKSTEKSSIMLIRTRG